ncbi:MAG: type II secretion system GspH family protein [Fibrobacter sp.]|nr:type II secretion system GspH family protein [Fibrobacter sp.]
MIERLREKKGYTLVEVLTVVSIMGILSAMGVVGLTGAIENSKQKDGAMNVTEFLASVAAQSVRMSEMVCVKKDGASGLVAYACPNGAKGDAGDVVDRIKFDDIFTIGCPEGVTSSLDGDDWLKDDGVAVFKPKTGLAAYPAEGFVCLTYKGGNGYSAAVKTESNNKLVWMKRSSNQDWAHR